MSPAQQAQVLIGKYIEGLHKNGNPNNVHQHAIQCAIICVEQIIPEVTLGVYRENRNHLMQEDYWKEVLNHLKSE